MAITREVNLKASRGSRAPEVSGASGVEILRARRLKLGFSSGEPVIREANFTVSRGDFTAIVGANGSGKSTLVRGILGLLKPLSGRVEFLNGFSAREIGYLPQETAVERAFPATVSEIVLTGALPRMRTRICYSKAEKQRMREVLKQLSISDLMNKSFNGLSGGQKQKVLLARALVSASLGDPRGDSSSSSLGLLILDEPSNNLDQRSKKMFYNLLKKLNRESGVTILMITHDIDAGDLIGNKVISISEGAVSSFSTEEYLGRFRDV